MDKLKLYIANYAVYKRVTVLPPIRVEAVQVTVPPAIAPINTQDIVEFNSFPIVAEDYMKAAELARQYLWNKYQVRYTERDYKLYICPVDNFYHVQEGKSYSIQTFVQQVSPEKLPYG